jgi:RNA polymerase sigma-70 factor (ECF subfamily)
VCQRPDDAVVQRRAAETEQLGALVRRMADRDEAAFTEFYDATNTRVYGLILRILRNSAYSEETMQDIYLEVWNTAHRFDASRGSAMAWLVTLAHRRTVDRVRSEQSSRDRDAVYHARSGSPDHDTVAESVAERLEAEAVTRCLETLTPKQREALDLAYYRGLTYREVADQLGTALPTMKSRIRDGLIGLQKCLGVAR